MNRLSSCQSSGAMSLAQVAPTAIAGVASIFAAASPVAAVAQLAALVVAIQHWSQIGITWLVVIAGSALGQAQIGSQALQAPVEALCATLTFAAVVTFIPLSAVMISKQLQHRLPAQIDWLLIPAIYATLAVLMARYSPLGVHGVLKMDVIDTYGWLLPIFGDVLPIVVLGLAAQSVATICAQEEAGEGLVESVQDEARKPRLRRAVYVLLVLASLALPSAWPYTSSPVESTPVTLSCVLPSEPSLKAYLRETRIVAGRGSKLVIWPEHAVAFSTRTELNAAFEQVSDIAKTHGAFIGVSYIDKSTKTKESIEFALVDIKGQQIATYAKQALVPLVESQTVVPGHQSAPTVELETPWKHWTPFSISPAICHDTAFSALIAPSKADLLIVPASVFAEAVSLDRIQHLRSIAISRRMSVFTCDQQGYSALIDPQGLVRTLQTPLDGGSFDVRIALSRGANETLYGRYGDLGALVLAIAIFCLPVLGGRLHLIDWRRIKSQLRRLRGDEAKPLLLDNQDHEALL